MKKLFLAFFLCLVWTGMAWAHLDTEGLPASVAIVSYRQTLYVNPDDLAARNKLAMALCRTNQLEEAKKELQFVLKKDAKDFNALDGMGVLLLKTGKYQDAVKYLEKAVKIHDKDLMVHVHLSAAYQKMKLSDKAKSEWNKARSLASNRAELKEIKEEWKWVTGR